MQDNVSNVGTVGSTGLEGNQLTEQNWADFPVGFGGMMRSGNQSYGNPGSTYFYFHKIANRDSGGGWGGIAVGYSNNAELYVGTTTVNTSYATWSKIWNESNLGISNLANDRILTGNGSSSIRGESNVTINSSNNLTIGGGGQLTLTGGTNAVINVNSTADSFIEKDSGTNLYLANNVQDGDLLLRVNDGGTNKTAISIDASDNARVKLPYDNQRLAIGAGQDLQINHDGSNTYIDNYTGQFNIINNQDDGDIIFKSDNGSGGVTEYLRLDGGAAIVYVFKELHLSSHLDMGDSDRIKLGDSDDLQIVHDSNINFIHSTISDRDIYFRVNDGGTNKDAIIIDASENARVRIPNDDQRLTFGAGNELQLSHESNNNYIATYSGHLILEQNTNDADIIFNCDDGSGGVTAYLTLDGSQTRTYANKTIRTPDSVTFEVGNAGDGAFFHNGSNTFITNSTGHFYIDQYQDDGDIIFRNDNGSGGNTNYMVIDGGATAIDLLQDTRLKAGKKLYLDGGGNSYYLGRIC